jgi:hypothetical protein
VKRAVVCLALTALLAALTPLAFASPPDPTWIAGVWDDGDHDDAVLLVSQATAFVPAVFLGDAPVGAVIRTPHAPIEIRVPGVPDPGVRRGRAPPTA